MTRRGCRYYPFASLCNYGALPQTYEDPEIHEGPYAGDGDPLDVCEIGMRDTAEAVGNVYQVKVLGALQMVDQDEVDWKILAVRIDDPLADTVNGKYATVNGRIDMCGWHVR